MIDNVAEFRILHINVYERPMLLRLPFQFGDVVVNETTEAYLQVEIENGGKTHTGYSAQAMIPRWFDKRLALNSEQTVEELRETLRKTATAAVGMQGFVAEISAQVRELVYQLMPQNTPRLAAGFGPAMLEKALIDALCLALGCNFFQGVREDVFGLAKLCPNDLTPPVLSGHLQSVTEKYSMRIRHTVGYDAPLSRADIINNPNDGLPVSLEDVIEQTKVSAFKIKLKGNAQADIARLKKIAISLAGLKTYQLTIDANEQYTADEFQSFLESFNADSALTRIRLATLFIEQPFAREVALTGEGLLVPSDIPIIIDESDDCDESFVTAFDLGWSGTSVKSCKGVLRALLNFARVKEIQAKGGFAILSGEDLTCQPGLCWQQDTLMAAAVGVQHVERNGHHFAGGMQGAPAAEISAAMREHSDIYKLVSNKPTLNIVDGQVNFASLNSLGFGHSITPSLQLNHKLISV